MSRRIAVPGTALLALVVTMTYAQKEEAPKVYKTPQDVFDAAKAAAKKADYKTFYTTLTPESGDLLTGQMAMLGVMMKGLAELDTKGKAAKQMEPLFDAMKKHGLTDEYIKKLKPFNPKADQKEQMKAIKEMIKPIKKPADFIQDAMAAMKKINPKAPALDEIANDKLEDVKIDGDKATGNAVGKRPGKDKDKEVKTPLKFEKIQGSWKIVLTQPKQEKKDDD